MFLNFLQGRDVELFLYNGGLSTLRDYWGDDWEDQEELVLPPDHRRFLEELRLYYETEAYLFVHGGLKPGVPLAEQGEEDLLWIRGDFIASMEDFGKKVIFGHTPFQPAPGDAQQDRHRHRRGLRQPAHLPAAARRKSSSPWATPRPTIYKAASYLLTGQIVSALTVTALATGISASCATWHSRVLLRQPTV